MIGVIACTVFSNFYFSGLFEDLYIENLKEGLSRRAELTHGLAIYQNKLVKLKEKKLDQAMSDFVDTLKVSNFAEKHLRSNLFVGRVLPNQKLEVLFYSGETRPKDRFLTMIIDGYSHQDYLSGSNPVHFENGIIVTKVYRPWQIVVLSGIETELIHRSLSSINLSIQLFFTFLTLGIFLAAIALYIFFHKEWERAEGSYFREKLLFKNHPDFVMMLDFEGKIVEVSKGVLESIRMNMDEICGVNVWDTFWWGHSKVSADQIRDAIDSVKDGGSARFSSEHPTAIGDTLLIHHRILPVFGDDNHVKYILDLGSSSSEDQELHRAEFINNITSRYFFDNCPEAIVVHGLERGIISANAAALQLFSLFETSELKGHTLADFSPEFQKGEEDSASYLNEIFSRAMAIGTEREEWVLRDFHGGEHHVELLLFRGEVEGEPALFLIIRDIMDQKNEQSEGQLKIDEMQKMIDSQNELIASQSADLDRSMSELDRLMGRVINDNQNEPVADILHIVNDAIQVAFEKYDDRRIQLSFRTQFDHNSWAEKYPMRIRKLFALVADHCFDSIFHSDNENPELIVEIKRSVPYNIISFIDNRPNDHKMSQELFKELKGIASSYGGDLEISDLSGRHSSELLLPIGDVAPR